MQKLIEGTHVMQHVMGRCVLTYIYICTSIGLGTYMYIYTLLCIYEMYMYRCEIITGSLPPIWMIRCNYPSSSGWCGWVPTKALERILVSLVDASQRLREGSECICRTFAVGPSCAFHCEFLLWICAWLHLGHCCDLQFRIFLDLAQLVDDHSVNSRHSVQSW